MPQWILYMLAGAGALFFLMVIVYAITELLKNFNDRRLRIKSLKHTIYTLEGEISSLQEGVNFQNNALLELVRETKKLAIDLSALREWQSKVHRVTRTWEEFKEAGPDGP